MHSPASVQRRRIRAKPTNGGLPHLFGGRLEDQTGSDVAQKPRRLLQFVLELPRVVGGVWGSILSGITCAGAFAAFMSTFSGLLVSMTGALAHDVYGRILRPKSTPQERMFMFKLSAVLVGLGLLLRFKLQEPALVALAGLAGLALWPLVRPLA